MIYFNVNEQCWQMWDEMKNFIHHKRNVNWYINFNKVHPSVIINEEKVDMDERSNYENSKLCYLKHILESQYIAFRDNTLT